MYDIIELNGLLLTELKELAKEMEIGDYKGLKKQDLIYKILDQAAILPDDKRPDLSKFSGKQKPGRKTKAKTKDIVREAAAELTKEEPAEKEEEQENKPEPEAKEEEQESSEEKSGNDEEQFDDRREYQNRKQRPRRPRNQEGGGRNREQRGNERNENRGNERNENRSNERN